MKNSTKLRQLIGQEKLLMAPGASEALTARIVAKLGFDAVYISGAGSAAIRLGMPDVGLMTLVEMADNCQRIAEACGLPVIADADDGYGGPLNVQRTMRAYERAGVSAVQIEDQQWPKRCGHLSGKSLVSTADMIGKIKAACDARVDQNVIVLARTDALTVEGVEAALDRAAAYEEAGADVTFIESPETIEQLKRIPERMRKPTLFNMGASGKTPFLGAEEIQQMGFALAIYPNFALLAAISAATETLEELKRTGTVANLVNRITSFQDFFNLLGMDEVRKLEEKYGVDDAKRAGF